MAARPRPRSRSALPAALAVVAIIGVIGGAAWFARRGPEPRAVTAPVASPSAAVVPADAGTAVPRHAPTPIADTIPAPDPALDDASFLAALAELFGAEALATLVNPEYLIERTVATIDALPRRELGRNIYPLRPAGGDFVVVAQAEGYVVGDNAARHAPYVAALERVDASALVALYRRFEPRFARAWRELGYTDRAFEPRLREVLVHLLEAQVPGAPEPLARPRVRWTYAAPALEERSVGHKALMRLGPVQAERVKTKLREILAALDAPAG